MPFYQRVADSHSMFSLLLLVSVSFQTVLCTYHFAVRGYATPGLYEGAKEVPLKEIETLLHNEIERVASGIRINLESVGKSAFPGQNVVVFDAILTSVDRDKQNMISALRKTKDVHFIYWRQTTKVAAEKASDSILFDDKNVSTPNGFFSLKGASNCPSFVSGRNCEVISCQRHGIFDGVGCNCAPGTQGRYCEANDVYLEFTKIVNTKEELVAFFHTEADGLDSPSMPVMEGLQFVQKFSSEVNPFSTIVVFTDTVDNTEQGTRDIYDDSMEIRATETTLFWRNRPVFIFIENSQQPVDYASTEYDRLRRTATNTQGDLVVVRKEETVDAIQQLIPRLFKQEFLQVHNFVLCEKLSISVDRDDEYQRVYVLVTLDTSENKANISLSGDRWIYPDHSANYWSLFAIPSQMSSVSLEVSPPAVCSVKVFVHSSSTLLWAVSQDEDIDGGNVISLAEVPTILTVRPVNFPPIVSLSVEHSNSLSTRSIFKQIESISRSDCVFPFIFKGLPSCIPGPFSQKYNLKLKSGKTIHRIYTGLCGHSETHPDERDLEIVNKRPAAAENGTCSSKNYEALKDGTSEEFQQIVFALETTSKIKDVLSQLADVIAKSIAGLEKDQLTREFTLITFDGKGSSVVFSKHDQKSFILRLNALLKEKRDLPNGMGGVHSTEAVYQASRIHIRSPTVIHLFTASHPKTIQRNIVLPTDIRVNIYNITDRHGTTQNGVMRLIEKQTGGRIVKVPSNSVAKLNKLISTHSVQSQVVMDSAAQFCDMELFSFEVEEAVTKIQFTIFAENVTISPYVLNITDGKGSTVELRRNGNVHLAEYNTVVFEIEKSQKLSHGTWTLALDLKGPCFLKVHVLSSVKLSIGFSSDPLNDYVSSHPFSRRGKGAMSMAAFGGSKIQGIERVSVQPINHLAPHLDDFEEKTVLTNMSTLAKCAYPWRTEAFWMPLHDVVKLEVAGKDSFGQIFQRQFVFFTPKENNVCGEGVVSETGECACSKGFSGEFCEKRQCMHGGTRTDGVCLCKSGYYGRFCERVVKFLLSSNATSDSTKPSHGSTLPTEFLETTTSSAYILSTSALFILLLLSFC